MKNMKIGKKLVLGFGVTIVASIILMAISILSVRKVGNLTNDMYEGPFVESTEALEKWLLDLCSHLQREVLHE